MSELLLDIKEHEYVGGMIDLRLRNADEKSLSALEEVLGIGLPLKPRRSVVEGKREAIWMSVDQWLVFLPREDLDALLQSLEELRASSGMNLMATDMSDARSVIVLRGDGVREVLMKGIAVDFLAFSVGEVRRCSLGGVAVLVRCCEEDVFEVFMFRSYLNFVSDWLNRAGASAAAVKLFHE
ncbi:MAG: hypothetical protein OXF05_00530 [Hyphomicrobiales bacterium]|nr:hypothetical protein [Hyphomicrobiales bacterium]